MDALLLILREAAPAYREYSRSIVSVKGARLRDEERTSAAFHRLRAFRGSPDCLARATIRHSRSTAPLSRRLLHLRSTSFIESLTRRVMMSRTTSSLAFVDRSLHDGCAAKTVHCKC